VKIEKGNDHRVAISDAAIVKTEETRGGGGNREESEERASCGIIDNFE
jgi:hypothetical protein